nr:Ig-like domain-containing protein [Methanobacterium alcaliphilum]
MDGTYSGAGNSNITISDLGVLSIIGENYDKAIIDGELTNWIFKFGSYTQANLENLTIKNAKSDVSSYSPVLRTTGSVNIKDCIFENNYSTISSPIIYVDSAAEVNNTVKNLIFRNNIVTGSYYASFYIRKGTIDNSSFINNTNIGSSSGAKNGAAVSSQAITITNSEFINNTNLGTVGESTITGGAVKVNGNFVSINNTYLYNYAAGYGGAVLAQSLTSINDTFIGNNATYGGAFYSYGNITGSIFANNSATTYGGAIYANSNINLHNCSFTNNAAGTNGNDVYLSSSTYDVGKIGSGNLTFESLNSTIISNILKAYLRDSEGNIISGGNVSFYVGGKYIGVAELINGLAQINCIGFDNGIYDITGNYSQADNLTVQGAVLNISAEILDNLDLYISPTGSDDTGNGTESNPYATINKALIEGLEKTQNLFIHLLAGTYKGPGIFNLTLPNAVNLTITGASTNQTFLDGENVNWLFRIIQGFGVTKLNNLTITNSLAPTTVGPTGGDGIIQNYGNMLIENCAFVNNIRTSIVNERSGNLTIKNTYFYNNTGAYNAGAVANFGNAVIDNCLFVANACTNYGSAIFNAYNLQNNATLLVMDTIIRDTITTHSRGAAVYLGSNSTFKNCYFTNNTMYDIYTSVSTGEPYVTLINTTFYNSTGFGAYGGSHWSIYNSSFVNLKNTITFGSSYSIIIDGCLFNNPMGLIISGSSLEGYNSTMSNSAVLNSLTLYSGLYYLDNNWWGNNSKPTILPYASYVPTVVLDKWIIMSLTTNNAPGLSQIINMAIKSTDGNTTYDYDVSKIPIPSEDKEFVFNVSNGTIMPDSGNASAQGMNATYSHNQYGNQTVNAVFNRSTVSLDIELYQFNTTTTIGLSNSTGRQGNVLILTADVVDSDSTNPVNVGEVEFFVGTRSIGKANVQNGRATLNWIVDEDKGDYEINVRYNGTESYVSSENNTMFSVTSINTTTILNISNSTPKYGDRINLTSNVTETASGNPVGGGIVNFLVDNVLIGTANVVNGLASLNWVVDQDIGQHNITSEYNGIGDYLNSSKEGSLEQVVYTGTEWFIYTYMTNTQIQYIMDNCVSGCNIIFTNGNYSKLFLTVSKPLNIKNNGVVNIVGDGTGTAFTIIGNNVSLSGLNIKNYTNGVLNKANTVTMAGNTFTSNVNGIVNYGNGSNVKINTANMFQSNKGSAIYNYGNNVVIKGQKLVNNKVGITNKGFNVDLVYNTISGGEYGILNYGKAADINYNKISSTSKAGVYNTGSSTKIGRNTLMNNYCGVDNRGSSSQISYNTVSGGTTGLMNKASSTRIYSNSIKSVKSYGVYNYGSSNKIYKNTISGTKKGYGIYSKGSKYTLIQSNTVYNFSYGVFSADYKDNIKSNVLRYNNAGLYLYKTSKYASVSSNKMYKNTAYGVYNKGSKTTLYKNQVTSNKKIGLATVKSVSNKKNTIRKNKVNIRYIK